MDLALWPHSTIHLCFGLWRRLPGGWWWLELVFIAIACPYYAIRAKREKTFGGHALGACAVVVTLHILNAPWLSATK